MLDREKTGRADASTPMDTTTSFQAVAQRRIRELTDDPAGAYSGDGGAAMTGANGNVQTKRSGRAKGRRE